MSMKIGVDLVTEKVYIIMGDGNTDKQALMTADTARAVAAHLVATADTLDHAMNEGWPGKDDA